MPLWPFLTCCGVAVLGVLAFLRVVAVELELSEIQVEQAERAAEFARKAASKNPQEARAA